MERLDDLFGWFNFLPRLFGGLRTLRRPYRGRRKQPHSRWTVKTYRFPRPDKGGRYTRDQVIQHLGRYGVEVVAWNFDGRNWYIKVRKNQARWAAQLLGEAPSGGALWKPESAWRERNRFR